MVRDGREGYDVRFDALAPSLSLLPSLSFPAPVEPFWLELSSFANAVGAGAPEPGPQWSQWRRLSPWWFPSLRLSYPIHLWSASGAPRMGPQRPWQSLPLTSWPWSS